MRGLYVFLFSLISVGKIFCSIPMSVAKIRKSKTVREHIASVEKQYAIPKNLLLAIASIESKLRPWVINYSGRSKYFSTKEAMIDFVQKLRKKGVRNLSVGCMQLHLPAHLSKFKSLSELVEPGSNVEYAGRLLKRLYSRLGSWDLAIKCYHSGSSHRGSSYLKRVQQIWRKAHSV